VTQQLGRVESGPGIYAQNLIKSLKKAKYDVTVITHQNQVPENDLDTKIISVKDTTKIKSQARWFIYSIRFSKKITELEQSTSFDIIHFTDFRDAFFCKTSATLIANINDTYCAETQSVQYYRQNYHDWLPRWLYYSICRLLERIFVNRIDLLIANSDYTKNSIQRVYPNIASKLIKIYKSVNTKHFQSVRSAREQNDQPYPHNVIMVGSNLQRKGIYTLIAAAKTVLQHVPDTKFLIAGNDPSIPRLKKICKEIGIDDSFKFLGNLDRPKLLDLYQNAGVMVLPALTEALGVVLLEAMASGIPVIASNVGGIPEIIKNKENGLLIPPKDSALLSESIIRIFDDKELRKHLISQGLIKVGTFSLENMISDTFAAYHHILDIEGVS
jgi:glycosyltransferase involved in cell wall biosynthesis